MSRTYRPRALLRLTILPPGKDEPITFDVRCSRARVVRNDHNHADTLSVTASWVDAGVDPRWISGATCEFYMWDDGRARTSDAVTIEVREAFGLGAESDGPGADDLRFMGRLVSVARSGEGDKLTVEMEFHDYTSFFLLAKPVATSATPLYSENLGEAWARICASVPGAAPLAGRIELRGLDSFPVIGSAVAERFRKKGVMAVKPGLDAWALWQQAVGMMGLISFIERDVCVVTAARGLYTASNPPRIVWGRNLLSFKEERNNDRARKGVIITSFDPLTGKTLEAVFSSPLNEAKKLLAKTRKGKGGGKGKASSDKEYDVFAYPGITDQTALDALAERVYTERSRQELEGSLSTADMDAPTASGESADLLSLGSGDAIEVRFVGDDDVDFVRRFDSADRRSTYLEKIGYRPQVADLVAANVATMGAKSNLFHVKSVTCELTSEGDGKGSFKVDIAYCNKIDPKGGTAK